MDWMVQTAEQGDRAGGHAEWDRSTLFWAMVVVICWVQPKPIPIRAMSTQVTKRGAPAVIVDRASVPAIMKTMPMTGHIP